MRIFKAVAVVGITATLFACQATQSQQNISNQQTDKPKNVIMVVADGMGPAYITAYRNYRDNPNTETVEPVVFDDILVGTATTYPASVSGYVTDSAASATALAAGIKTYNGAIGVDVNKQPVRTVLHQARLNGMKTGIAVTSQIVHATPAAYVAANESRENYNQLADSYYDDRINEDFILDVMLGGGQRFFERSDRNITGEFIDAGYQYVDTYNQLATLTEPTRVLGLFAPVAVPWALDDSRANRLEYMTRHAIKHLENANGFFLLVEASLVDWAGHANDISSAMAEMHDLALTIQLLRDYVRDNPDTLVVLTADHSTGGLSIAADGEYRWSPEFLHSMQLSVPTMVEALPATDDWVGLVEQGFGFKLSEAEQDLVLSIDTSSSSWEQQGILNDIIDARTNTGWTTSGHTGEDVGVFSFGQGAERFSGAQDNTAIATKLFDLLGTQVRGEQNQKHGASSVKQEEVSDEGANTCSFKDSWRC
ncbi:alkaline phosphatase [Alteromonas sp. ASW11-36]|uniref:Alkaline phosphatase n=1 Tax=Alteromonas arenosi TaxID=3055817 RepID=A0ABT7STY5_9ALTE|nr:alkaline phosphatase [Alteromonas sp. ASW11-36]MDM7859663.1 alkaline phosphatase [Alteromonas sp. ASW11-36]